MCYYALPEYLFKFKDYFICFFPYTVDRKWKLVGRMGLKRSTLIVTTPAPPKKKEKKKVANN